MVNLTLNSSAARKLAADTFSELSDAEYQSLLMRVMREGQYRKTLDVATLQKAFTKAFGPEVEKASRAIRSIDEF